MSSWLFLGFILLGSVIPLTEAFGQEVIIVNQTTPCFLNYTNSYNIFEACGADRDLFEWIVLGFEYITGGYFSMIIVSVIILTSYLAFHKVEYPITIGILFLPISFFAFPAVFVAWAIVMAFIGIGIGIWFIYVRQARG